jgi:hypothetical protein
VPPTDQSQDTIGPDGVLALVIERIQKVVRQAVEFELVDLE